MRTGAWSLGARSPPPTSTPARSSHRALRRRFRWSSAPARPPSSATPSRSSIPDPGRGAAARSGDPMSALVCGSLAFDSIATFDGRFADQILPNQLHVLNVSFLVPTLRREFGGCAGNIAYNLAALRGG